jgi:hypothetical protein
MRGETDESAASASMRRVGLHSSGPLSGEERRYFLELREELQAALKARGAACPPAHAL